MLRYLLSLLKRVSVLFTGVLISPYPDQKGNLATATEDFECSYILFIIIIGGILVLYIYRVFHDFRA
jgi:hypothetical protein